MGLETADSSDTAGICPACIEPNAGKLDAVIEGLFRRMGLKHAGQGIVRISRRIHFRLHSH